MKQLCSELINEVSVFLSICSSHLLTFAEKKTKRRPKLAAVDNFAVVQKAENLGFLRAPGVFARQQPFWREVGGQGSHPPTSCYISKTLNLSLENVTKYESSISPPANLSWFAKKIGRKQSCAFFFSIAGKICDISMELWGAVLTREQCTQRDVWKDLIVEALTLMTIGLIKQFSVLDIDPTLWKSHFIIGQNPLELQLYSLPQKHIMSVKF